MAILLVPESIILKEIKSCSMFTRGITDDVLTQVLAQLSLALLDDSLEGSLQRVTNLRPVTPYKSDRVLVAGEVQVSGGPLSL